MPEPRKRQAAKATQAPVYQLKVTLEGIEPKVWRRHQVPGDANLGWLHAALQVAMGWTDSYMHHCIVGERLRSDAGLEPDDDLEVLDENATAVMDIAPRVKSAFLSEDDFGDSWEHRIVVEKILDPDPTASTSRLIRETPAVLNTARETNSPFFLDLWTSPA